MSRSGVAASGNIHGGVFASTPAVEGLTLKLWGHSYLSPTGVRCSPGAEFFNRVAKRLGLGSVLTYGVTSGLLIDSFWDIMNGGAAGGSPAGGAIVGSKLNVPGAAYHGYIHYVESVINDIFHPQSGGGNLPTSLTAKRQTNYQDTLRGMLAAMRAQTRVESSVGVQTPAASWATVTDSRYSGGSFLQATTQNAALDIPVTFPTGGGVAYVIGVDQSDTATGTAQVILDPAGANTLVGTPSSAGTNWEAVYTTRSATYTHTRGPWVQKVTATAGAHTIRVIKTDASANPVNVDVVLVQSPQPIPTIVGLDPVLPSQGASYATAKATFDTLVNNAIGDFPNDGTIKLLDYAVLSTTTGALSTLDPIHPGDLGMDLMAQILAAYLATFTYSGNQTSP